jgi:hypothetical protein
MISPPCIDEVYFGGPKLSASLSSAARSACRALRSSFSCSSLGEFFARARANRAKPINRSWRVVVCFVRLRLRFMAVH